MVLTRDMGANPDSDIRCDIKVSGNQIWLVLLNRRGPVNGNAAQNKAEEERHIQPVTPAHQDMVSFNHEHVCSFKQRARSVWLVIQRSHMVHWASPLLAGVLGRRGNKEKDLVRYKCSVRELLSRRVDDIARAESDLLRCD